MSPTCRCPIGQDALIEAVAAAQPRSVVLLETGGPVLMPWLARVPAVVEAWYPGQRGGEAIANVLTGPRQPVGPLADHLPRQCRPAAAPVAGRARPADRRSAGGRRRSRAGGEGDPCRASPSTTAKAPTSAIAGTSGNG